MNGNVVVVRRIVLGLACVAVIGLALVLRGPASVHPGQQPVPSLVDDFAQSTCAYVQSHLPELAARGQHAACVDQTPQYGVSPAEEQRPPAPDPPPLPVRTSSP